MIVCVILLSYRAVGYLSMNWAVLKPVTCTERTDSAALPHKFLRITAFLLSASDMQTDEFGLSHESPSHITCLFAVIFHDGHDLSSGRWDVSQSHTDVSKQAAVGIVSRSRAGQSGVRIPIGGKVFSSKACRPSLRATQYRIELVPLLFSLG